MSRPITTKNKSYLDSMIIGSGHSIMSGNIPEVVQEKDKLVQLTENFFSWTNTNKESVQSLGFWGGDIDYNTYYPELNPDELTPKDNEFITPMFRLLSETIVSKNYNPTDFSRNGVLKASMKLLLGQTVNCDHETNIGNAIGAVSKVVWQDSYKDGKFVIPGGINGILKIDGKANPRIARGILMDPPSIHSNSVTVQFKWEKSHPELSDEEFWQKLGTYDENGVFVCRVVTEVIRYLETSLVSHGADSFAQKIGEDGKIVNPEFAHRTWNSFKEYDNDKLKQYSFMDNKLQNYVENDTQLNNDINKNSFNLNEDNKMNEELKEFLEKLFGKNMLTLGEGKEATQEEAISLIQNLVSDKNSLSEKVTNLTAENAKLAKEIVELTTENTSLKEVSEYGKKCVTNLREAVVANYKKIQGDKLDEKDPVLIMLNSETTPLITLEGLNKNYEQTLKELFPMKCSKCGSKDISRASSVQDPEEPDTTSNHEGVVDNATATNNILARKNKYNRE